MLKVLIIDDEKPVATAISAMIDWESYQIQSPPYIAMDGKAGLEIMKQYRPEIVFVDMRMPIMNGTEFLKIASVDYPDSKYIVISGYDDFNYAQAAIRNGAIDYILKPVGYDDLKGVLEKAIELLDTKSILSNTTLADSTETDNVSPRKLLDPKDVIREIKEYIEENYCSQIKIKTFSDKYFFSKEYLSKLFKKSYGMGIYEYVLKLKMKKAKELLEKNELQIQEISDYLGYSNNNYFSKAFRNYYGISPSECQGKSNPNKM
jgi:YesN/AraC family two-component response regulator